MVVLQGTIRSGLLQTSPFLSTVFLLETCCPPQTEPIIPPESWFFSGNMQDNCIFPAVPHKGEMTCSLTPSSRMTGSTSKPAGYPPWEQGQSSESWGLENLLSMEGLFTFWEKNSSFRIPSLSPEVFVGRTLLLCGDFLFFWSMSSGVHCVSSPQTLRANVYLCN